VGDALGAPVEFMKRTEILRRFGPNGIATYAPAYARRGTWGFRGITSYVNVTAHAYLRWLQRKMKTRHLKSIPGPVKPAGYSTNENSIAGVRPVTLAFLR
jgi:ADP-ribosylglycohydrolase